MSGASSPSERLALAPVHRGHDDAADERDVAVDGLPESTSAAAADDALVLAAPPPPPPRSAAHHRRASDSDDSASSRFDDIGVSLAHGDDHPLIGDGSHAPPQRTRKFFFVSAFFVTIATVLGTGILSLPVKLAQSGFWPMLVTFAPCALMQVLVLVFMVELLQRASSIAHFSEGHGPDLHLLGKLFLPRGLQIVFDIAVMIHFLSILISYSLAGPQAWATIFSFIAGFQVNFMYVIAPFIILLMLIVVFAQKGIAAVVTVLTLSKGSLLVLMVAITGYIGSQIGLVPTSNWLAAGHPFLIGTVALGGAANVIPIAYAKIQQNKEDMKLFRMSICLALIVCFLLNVFWCYFVLWVVPQTGPNPSLQYAQSQGLISTAVLVEIIRDKFPSLTWIAIMVDVFIVVSITVSFMTMSSATKHVLDGYVTSGMQSKMKCCVAYYTRLGRCWTRRCCRSADLPESACTRRRRRRSELDSKARVAAVALTHEERHAMRLSKAFLYLTMWGLVLIIAQFNLRSFLVVLEYFTSAALNIEAGLCIALMVFFANRRRRGEPLLGLGRAYHLWIVAALYFCSAVLYDVVTSIMEAAGVHT